MPLENDMLSSQELLDIWHDEYGDVQCPFVKEGPKSNRQSSTVSQVMWYVDIPALDVYPVQAHIDTERELAWVSDTKTWYITGVALYKTREEAFAAMYSILAAEFRRLIEAKERLDAKVNDG